MRTHLTFFAVLALCAALFFIAPHHSRRDPFRPRTLAGQYWDLVSDLPELLEHPNAIFLLLAIAGLVTCFYPPILVVMIRFLTAGGQRRGSDLFVVAGLVGLAGALANFIAMIALDMNLSFGGSVSSTDQTAFVALIPLFQITFALASIAIGVSSTCANWAHRLVVAI